MKICHALFLVGLLATVACGGRIAPSPEEAAPAAANDTAGETGAQRTLAYAFCRTCVADKPSADCVSITLADVGPGAIGGAILDLGDAASRDGLRCADIVGASQQPSPFVCEKEFVTCLESYRPTAGP